MNHALIIKSISLNGVVFKFVNSVHRAIENEGMNFRACVSGEIITNIDSVGDDNSDVFAINDATKDSLFFILANQITNNIHNMSSVIKSCQPKQKIKIYSNHNSMITGYN